MNNVLRGLHLQEAPHAQYKLVYVPEGEVFDVAVDLRRNSKTFGQWQGFSLSSENNKLLLIPPGFAHGFYTISGKAVLSYKTSDYYHPESEKTLQWNDPEVNIQWPTKIPILSERDKNGMAISSF
jgi:dTDP-4-dehydrorhamnose 3,5-epimerase